MGSIAHSAATGSCFLQGDRRFWLHTVGSFWRFWHSPPPDATLRPWLVLWLHLLPTYRVSRLLMVADVWLRITESVDAAIRKWGYVQQWNLDIPRQTAGWLLCGRCLRGLSRRFIYSNTPPMLISFLTPCGLRAGALTVQVANPMAGTNPNPSLNGATVAAGQLERPYPQYNGLSLAGYGCVRSSYNSLQA